METSTAVQLRHFSHSCFLAAFPCSSMLLFGAKIQMCAMREIARVRFASYMLCYFQIEVNQISKDPMSNSSSEEAKLTVTFLEFIVFSVFSNVDIL